MRLRQTFQVAHPVGPVWTALTDLTVVAGCLPGATVTSVSDGVHYGNLTVRLGSIRAAFGGTAELTDVDPGRRTVSLVAEGGGAQGQVRLRLNGSATVVSPATTEIRLDTEVDLTGRLAQLGHGAAGPVTERMIQQLAANLDRYLSGAPTANDDAALTALSFLPALAKGALGARSVRLALTAVAGLLAGIAYPRTRRRRA
jgi:uncharacterized protein